MRLEVLVDNNDPVVYPLSGQKITIGSSENCDIVLNSEGVSRKHLSITPEADSFFVVDLGSSNGSYINEERLIPGKRAEFTSFFPVRLGQNVLLSLLSDEEAESGGMIEIPIAFKEKPAEVQPDVKNDQTRVINLNDLTKKKTEKLISTRNEKRNEIKSKVTKSPPKKKKNNFTSYLALLVFVGGAGYNFFKNKQEKELNEEISKPLDKKVSTKNSPKNQESQAIVEVKPPSDLVPEEDFVKKSSYESIINDLKCTNDEEKYLCLFFPGTSEQPFGVVQVGLTYNVMADASAFIGHAKSFVKKPTEETPEANEEYQKLVGKTAAYIYLLRATAASNFQADNYKDARISIALYEKTETEVKLLVIVAIKPEVLNKLKEVVFESNLDLIRTNGFSALEIVKNHYSTY